MNKKITTKNRFTDNSNGTITDNLTGLIWLKDANAFKERTLKQALANVKSLANGKAELTDGSKAGDWRLPTVRELQDMVSNYVDCCKEPFFIDVQNSGYWTSDTHNGYSPGVWSVFLRYSSSDIHNTNYVWPVRTEQS